MKIYNSLTFQEEEFKPIRPNEISMYVCGPTVYDSSHLGHAKSAVAFDIIRRYFKFKGYNVKLVKNYTDIDDKIIARASERKIEIKILCDQYIKEYQEIMKILNIEPDYKNPKATDTIDSIIEFIQTLISKGHAYEKNESVYFSVKSFPKYEYLFQNVKSEDNPHEESNLRDQETDHETDKYDRRDFALWKQYKEGEPFWESPWGKGRPGWHIECSAMIYKHLGETIDIYGGGQDLKSPHHRNEIAQSEAYTGKPFANYFMHNGFVNVNNEKMSKSIGNFFLVSEVLKEYNPMVIRWFLISSHYRSSINYSLDNMKQAQKNYVKVVTTIKRIKEIVPTNGMSEGAQKLMEQIDQAEHKILNAMDNDFDTPIAIAEVLMLFRKLNKAIFEEKIAITHSLFNRFFKFVDTLNKISGVFSDLEELTSSNYKAPLAKQDELYNALQKLLEEIRVKLRERKLFDLSDLIRDRLKILGIKIEDKKS